ncbi:TPA: hypothetical protein U3L57_000064 [Streptococcus agalactiae]|nr:hypothetical protein [Streptococcus agalactiae]
MGIIILFVFCSFLALLFYYWDLYQHSKMMVKSIEESHWQEKSVIEYKAGIIKIQYPVLSALATSMTYTNDRFTSKEILKHTKVVDKKISLDLKNEIKKIVESQDATSLDVLKWYYLACVLISVKEQEHRGAIEVNKKSKKIAHNDYNIITGDPIFRLA